MADRAVVDAAETPARLRVAGSLSRGADDAVAGFVDRLEGGKETGALNGGSLQGGKIWGQFPSLALGGPNDANMRGTMVPADIYDMAAQERDAIRKSKGK